MLGSLRRSDADAVRLLTLTSVGLSAFGTLAVILPLLGLVDDVHETWARIFDATLVLLILTSVLPSILRRMQPAALHRPPGPEKTEVADEFLATAVIRIADRIEVLNSDPDNRAPEIHAEVRRLRRLAESFET